VKEEPKQADPNQPPPDVATSKMGMACLAVLILLVVGIIAVAALASRG
jgi:hypothetical protein